MEVKPVVPLRIIDNPEVIEHTDSPRVARQLGVKHNVESLPDRSTRSALDENKVEVLKVIG